MRMTFCGAAGTVTGSCYWVKTDHGQFLVDCGMFQGTKTLKQLNYGSFPFDPREIDFVLLTHAHIDHSGLIPKLVKQGFKGPIHATHGTVDLLGYMLPDSGYIQEMEVERLNRRNAHRGRPKVTPIYNREEALSALHSFSTVEYEVWQETRPGIRVRFWNAGHILGAASIEVEIAHGKNNEDVKRLLFSGDIGPENKLFHPDPDAPENWDYVCCESTYGGRERSQVTPESRRKTLAAEVNAALKKGGNLLIPSFAVERTQELLLDLTVLSDTGQIPEAPIFLDSPLAIRATEVFTKNADSLEDVDAVPSLFKRPNIRFSESVEESKMIARVSGGAIIMAGSGMCEAGRIRHHLRHNLWRNNSTVLLVGYQASGTLGSLLSQGATAVKIMGESITVGAAVRQIDVYSGHADGSELVSWIKERLPVKSAIFLTHGDDRALTALRDDLTSAGVSKDLIQVPQLDDVVELDKPDGSVRFLRKPHRLPKEDVQELDWHNELAEFSLRLRSELESAKDDKGRRALMRKMMRALDAGRHK